MDLYDKAEEHVREALRLMETVGAEIATYLLVVALDEIRRARRERREEPFQP